MNNFMQDSKPKKFVKVKWSEQELNAKKNYRSGSNYFNEVKAAK